jgi:hypothetical protein
MRLAECNVPLRPDEYQFARRVVDGRLEGAAAPRSMPFPLGRAFIAFGMALLFVCGQVVVACVTLLALIRSGSQLLLAAPADVSGPKLRR